MDAVGSTRAALLGFSEGAAMCIVFAATYPQRTSALTLYGAYAREPWAPDNPWGVTDEQLAEPPPDGTNKCSTARSPFDVPISPQDPEQLRRQHHIALLAALAVDHVDDHAGAVDVVSA